MRTKLLFALLFLPSIAFAQAQTMDQGCFLSFQTGECQEPKDFIWIDFGRDANKHTYGAPVAGLLNQAVRDRRQLLKWIRYSEKLEGKVRKLRARE